MQRLLITGGAGYIGSHAVLQGIQEGYQVKVVDSLISGHEKVFSTIEEMTGERVDFTQADIRNKENMSRIVDSFAPDFIMNFAALKSVGDGENFPAEYHDNNVNGLRNLLETLSGSHTRVIFSSTAAVYDPFQELPLTEDAKLAPINVYGKTKLDCEKLLQESKLQSVIFRYFNVVGNQESGLMGEYPEKATNLLPIVMQTLADKREKVTLFGANFATRDGYQERDYIDVLDIVRAHFLALQAQFVEKTTVMNLATGNSVSCLELFAVAEEITGKKLRYEIGAPRQGDPERSFASAKRALSLLGWQTQRSIQESVEAQWRWIQRYFALG